MQRYCMASKPLQILLILLVWTAGSLGGSAQTSVPPASTAALSPAVCPYRTANYITRSPAHRCLTTSLSAPSSTNKIETRSSTETTSQESPVLSTATNSSLPQTTLTQPPAEVRSDPPLFHPPTSAIVLEEETDLDSPLGKDNFLSFDEWKKRNLDKYGQSPEQIGRARKHDSLQPRRQPINILDSLGDDSEIDLDFSTFGSEKPQIAVPNHKDESTSDGGGSNRVKGVPKTKSRSKDAGTTFKERFNYASFDCAATILKTNTKCSGSSAVLVENKDSYMLNECSVENKFLILELCEDILIDTIVLANFEFFSSIFRTFRISVSDRYPVKLEKWKVLGTFEARNTREVQAFLVENPLIWTKYVRIEFLTHYGNEFYCPISLVRVHGTTMLEDYRHDEDPIKADDRDDEDDQVSEVYDTPETVNPEVVAEALVEEESSKIVAHQDTNVNAAGSTQEEVKQPLNRTVSFPHHELHASNALAADYLPRSTRNEKYGLFDLTPQQCLADGGEADEALESPVVRHSRPLETSKRSFASHALMSAGDIAERERQVSSTNTSRSTTGDGFDQSPTTQKSVQPSNFNLSTRTTTAHGSNSSRTTATSTQPPSSNPTIQESFFKSVQKRLQMLESNSTLSLQYIEEQSRILRDAFSKVEQRQLSKTIRFLDYLNGTVLNELRDFRQQYDQLWQSTVLELETQREQSQREVVAMNTRISILADELVFQKRMAVLQCILVLLCIILVLFPRGAMNSYLDHPLVQNMLTRSASFRMTGSLFDSPSLSPESTRPNSSNRAHTKAAYGIFKPHRRDLSDDSQNGTDNPAISYSPPTPASFEDHSEVGDRVDEHM